MRWRALAHPWCTGALALLAVNDQVLKRTVPSWWTGKLSDAAGVFLLAVVLGLVLGRPRLGVAAAAVGFAALKVVPGVAELAAPLLGGVTRRDPTDLVALVALWPALGFLEGGTDRSGRPERGLAVQVVAVLCGAGVVLATTATSCELAPKVDGFVVVGDSVVARVSGGYDGSDGQSRRRWAVSHDGGASWLRTTRPPGTVATGTAACAAGLGCVRTRHDRVEVQRTPRGPWRTSFRFTAAERHHLRERIESGCGSSLGWFGPVSVVERHDGPHVVVAMGPEGVLHRDPGGRWERRAVLDLEPTSSAPLSRLSFLLWAPAVGAIAGIALVIVGHGRRRLASGLAAFFTNLVGCGTLFVVSGMIALAGKEHPVAGPVIAALTVGLFAASLLVARRD